MVFAILTLCDIQYLIPEILQNHLMWSFSIPSKWLMLFIIANTFLNALEWPRLTMTDRRMARNGQTDQNGEQAAHVPKDTKQNINKTNL